MGYFAKELLVNDVGFRLDCNNSRFWESLGNHTGSKVVIRMRMGKVNRCEIFACFQDFRDNSVGIGQGPLCVKKHGILLPYNDNGSDFKSVLVAEKGFGCQ
jgi:hypothetical protein